MSTVFNQAVAPNARSTSHAVRSSGWGTVIAALWVVTLSLLATPGTAAPDTPRVSAVDRAQMRAHAYTLSHRMAREALPLVRPFLSPNGTVEEQPGSNTLVIRDVSTVIGRIVPVLERFDQPPEDLRFDIQIVRAGPHRGGVSPPQAEETFELSGEVAERLRELLRYDSYQVLAEAAVTSSEGQRVTYSLGQSYSVSFRLGTILGGSQASGERLRLEDFRIVKHVRNPSNKGRQLEPQELFRATLNLWIDRPFNLVLAQDSARQEALMVAISCRREDGQEAESAPKP